MNMDVKIFNKILANQIKRIIHHNQVGFTSGRHGCFNILKSTNVINHTNKIKKTPQIISIGSEKVFDNIQHPFMIKTLDKPGTEGNLFKRTKGILENTTADIMVNGESLYAFPLKSETRQACLLS